MGLSTLPDSMHLQLVGEEQQHAWVLLSTVHSLYTCLNFSSGLD